MRNICAIRRVDRVRNVIIRERSRCELSVMKRIKRNMERMGEERFVKIVYWANMEGNRVRGRLQKRWRDGVKDLLLGRGLNEREGMRLARDDKRWR